jgi:predicted  nucleic acid-binding Zn-ribbon protein
VTLDKEALCSAVVRRGLADKQALEVIGRELNRAAAKELDGRVIRLAQLASQHIREGQTAPEELRKLRDEFEKLREEQKSLRDRLARLEPGNKKGAPRAARKRKR